MSYFKKLIFGLPFILATFAFGSQAAMFFKDFLILFSFDMNLLFQLIFFAITIVATAYLFLVFANLASDWVLVLPLALLSSIAVFFLTVAPISYFLAGGLFVAFCLSSALLFNKIKKDPTSFHTSSYIIKPSGQLITLIILITSATLYFSVSTNKEQVVQKLVDSVVNFSTDLLKQDPQLLKQFGLDTSVLNQFDTTNSTAAILQNAAVEATKPVITKQVTDLITPYLFIIPYLIAFIFYLNFQFFTSIISLLFYPIIYLLFWILEKVGFIHFETETREVKKLIV